MYKGRKGNGEKMGKRAAFIVFVWGIIVTFSSITALQFVSIKNYPVIWVLILVSMHVGIVLFIVSKKQFNKYDLPVRNFYRREYYFLLWYLPVLAAKIFLPIFTDLTFEWDTTENYLKVGFVVGITAVFVIESIFNALAFKKILNTKISNN